MPVGSLVDHKSDMKEFIFHIILLVICGLHVSVPDSTDSLVASIKSENALLRNEIDRLRFLANNSIISQIVVTEYCISVYVLDRSLLMDLLCEVNSLFQSTPHQ